jgi:thiosulfate reductase cytochrome b subunit
MHILTGLFRPIRAKSLFPAWSKPDSYWDVVVAHLPMALLTGLGLFASVSDFP